jgi:hypothetical protein
MSSSMSKTFGLLTRPSTATDQGRVTNPLAFSATPSFEVVNS